jgi:hypothetical protein
MPNPVYFYVRDGYKKSHRNGGSVTPIVQFSNQLMEKFKKIYELKAVIPVVRLQPAVLPK